MRAWWILSLLLLTALAGCADDGAPDDDQVGETVGEEGGVEPDWQTLRFTPENRSVVEADLTVTVSPQDAAIGPAGAQFLATGSDGFIVPFDISQYLPDDMQAYVEVEATWERTSPIRAFQFMQLTWWSWDAWLSGVTATQTDTKLTWSGFVSQYGPDPAEMAFVTVEPEDVQPVDVDVHVKVTPLDGRAAAYHGVAVDLGGGAAPIQVFPVGGGATVHVRGPDDAVVVTKKVTGSGGVVRLPADAPAGKYRIFLFDTEAPSVIRVPAANLTGPPSMRLVHHANELSDAVDIPPGGEEVTSSTMLPSAPYYLAVRLEATEGASDLQGANIALRGPDGQEILSEQWACSGCLYSTAVFGTGLVTDMPGGEYTAVASAATSEGWTVRLQHVLLDDQ